MLDQLLRMGVRLAYFIGIYNENFLSQQYIALQKLCYNQLILNNFNMPLLFKTEVRESSVHGKGFFALQDIPQGACYWAYECNKEKEVPLGGYSPESNVIHNRHSLQNIKDHDKLKEILHGGIYYEENDVFVELRDGTQFMNHSDSPNSQIIYNPEKDINKLYSVAKRHIKAGEEIMEAYSNYFSRRSKWLIDLMEKHIPERAQFEAQIEQDKPLGIQIQ